MVIWTVYWTGSHHREGTVDRLWDKMSTSLETMIVRCQDMEPRSTYIKHLLRLLVGSSSVSKSGASERPVSLEVIRRMVGEKRTTGPIDR